MSNTAAAQPLQMPRRQAPAKRGLAARAIYLARVLQVYAAPRSGPLSFWYEDPRVNDAAFTDGRSYFMTFQGKADYHGPFDTEGVPLLDYRGEIGRQHNPIAIAQFGLARFNRWIATGSGADRAAWLTVARWLTHELRPNRYGVTVWFHHFDWPYRQLLTAPWYSGLAQGNGVSMLVRAAEASGETAFGDAAHRAFESFRRPVSDGGVVVTDRDGLVWIEEYLVEPPSHILNGFIWALWGVYDYARWSGRADARALWQSCLETLRVRLKDYDTGWWSLYELPAGNDRMLASRYYHRLHITQLSVLHRLTGIGEFKEYGERFERYLNRRGNRARALATKAVFKLRNY